MPFIQSLIQFAQRYGAQIVAYLYSISPALARTGIFATSRPPIREGIKSMVKNYEHSGDMGEFARGMINEFNEGMYQRYASKTIGSLKFNQSLFRDPYYDDLRNYMHAERSGGSSFYLPSFVDQNLIPSFDPNTRFSLDDPLWWSGSSLIGFPQIGDDTNSTSSSRQELNDALYRALHYTEAKGPIPMERGIQVLQIHPIYLGSCTQVRTTIGLYKMIGTP